MTTVAWFHCFAGIAGDMALGSLVDAGADPAEVTALVRRLPVAGWELGFERVQRGGLSATRAVVTVTERDPAVVRTGSVLEAAIAEAGLPARVERRARDTVRALAEVEGRLHGTTPAEVHLHEVGGHDALVDVVGTAAALEVLGVDQVATSPVAVGTGTVQSAHGVLPNPPPAVVRLLEGFPTYGRPVPIELTTPTGAAILAAMATSRGPMPPMTVTASGYGAGSAELETLPNCTQVVVGTALGAGSAGPGQPVTVLETTVDDVTGEQLAHALAELLNAGAFDAWVSPVVMKKGRPGHTVHVLCDPARSEALGALMRTVTGSFGVRALDARRWPEARRTEEVAVTGQTVRMKVGRDRVKPEHDDVARAAEQTGLGLREVASRAEEAWRRRP